MRLELKMILLAGLLAFAALPVAAQEAMVYIRGTVEKSDAQTLAVKAMDGSERSFTLSSGTLFVANRPSSLDAIKAGDFVASAAVKGADGKLHSTELRIFPEALRGLGEGQRPMKAPNTMMTNAAVSEVVVVAPAQGRVLKVKYKDGTSELVVGPKVPITALVISDASVLKPGTKVTVGATKAADGAMAAKRVFAD